MNNEEKLTSVLKLLDDKKAIDIKTIDVKEVTTLTDYFVICSGTNRRHIQSLCDNIVEEMKKNDVKIKSREGYSTAKWILVDLGDVVINIFDDEDRKLYNLERLWTDGKIERDTIIKDIRKKESE